MKRWTKYSLITCGLILFLLLASMLIVPWQIKKQGIAWVEKETTRTLTIEKAYFNPFTLTVELKGLHLSEQNSDASFIAFDRLMISVSSRSIIDLALILDRVELDAPRVNLEQFAKQEFNFSDFTRLGDDQPPQPAKEPDKPFLFSFNNIVLNNGSVDFTDHTSVHNTHHTIRELNLSIPFVGNIPYLTDEYVEPLLSLILNGSEIRAKGQLKPFKHSIETSLTLMLDEIDLAFYAYHFPLPLPVEVKSGEIDAEIDLSYRVSSSEQPKLLLGGELALTDLDLRHADDSSLFKMPILILDLNWAEIFQQDINLFSLDIYEPELFVSRDNSGEWSFQRLLPAPVEDEALEEFALEEQPSTQPLFRSELMALHDGRIHYQDDFPLGGFSEEIQGINVRIDNFSTHLDDLAKLDFKLQTARDMTLAANGQLGLQPVTIDLAVAMNGFLLKPHYPFLADLLTKPLEGTLNLSSNVIFDAKSNLRLQEARMTLHDLMMPFGDKDQFTLQESSATGISFDLHEQQLGIGAIKLVNGDLTAARRADGSLTPLDLLRNKSEELATAESPEEETTPLPWQEKAQEAETEGLKITLAAFDIDNLNLQFSDLSLPKKPQLKIDQLVVSLKNLAYPESQQSPFSVNARIGREGTVFVSGNLAHSPLRLQAQTQIEAFPLTMINDFRPKNLQTSLNDGNLNASLAVKLSEQPETLSGSFSGRLSIEDFHVSDPLSNGELLSWESLGLEGIKGEISPFRLHIQDVSLSHYLAKILINQDGQINLASVTANDAVEKSASAEDEQKPQVAGKEAVAEIEPGVANSPLDIRIDVVNLQGGTVSFTDRHLPSTFLTTMYQLGGRVTGLSAEEQMQADVDLHGQLENHSPLTISGKLNPLSNDLYADLKISFKDIDLAPMTPYSGTYLGYTIDKGKLFLDLNYHIEHRKINADHKVMIDQFTFGDSTDSDQATSLPVPLAIALLKDSSGEIHLDLPVSGDLDDPSFSVAGTIFTILKNLLVKAATSPFSLLSSMFGGDEDFTSVDFTAGNADLTEKQQQQLSKLAEMLTQRPSLILEVSAYADRDKDPEAYRTLLLEQMLIDAKAAKLNEEGITSTPESELLISKEEYPKYLTQVYENADFPRPRNFVGTLKTLPVEEMDKLLLTNIPADDEQMQRLAQNRAMAVRDVLYLDNEEIKEQIFLKNVDIYQKSATGISSRVEFEINSK